MTVLIAPDSFKGTYSATEVAAHIAGGLRAAGSTAVEMPIADGGEGTLECLRRPMNLKILTVNSRNPWGCPTRAQYGLSDDGVAVIEIAEASGITTFHDGPRDPVTANTYGTGMLIADALRRGANHVILAAGGSATTDGGRGAIAAVRAADVSPARITVLADVTTRFVDAAAIFGPQKGADPATVDLLAHRLDHQASALPRDPREISGSGAAGGFAGGLWATFDADIVPGADYILDRCGFDRAVSDADAVVVGEGRLDSQTKAGKIISAVLRRAGSRPVYAVVGSVGDYHGDDFAEVFVATDADAMREAGAKIAVLRPRYVHQ